MDWGDKRVLGAVMSAVVSSVMASGCGFPVDPSDLNPPACLDGVWQPIAGLQLPVEYDYVSVWQGGVDLPPEMTEEEGELCAGATDRDACTTAYFAVEEWSNHLRTTSGDQVQVWSSEDGLLDLIGEVDAGAEALLLAWGLGDAVVCGDLAESGWAETETGWQVLTTSYTSICDPIVQVRTLREISRAGAITEVAVDEINRSSACIGRRPAGLCAQPVGEQAPVQRWLAEAARLEAASVLAFEQLAEELRLLGAPEALIRGAREAADDERRHAAQIGALARSEGAEPGEVQVAPSSARGLYELALDNAVEGCVRETFGALAGLWQADAARDPAVAGVMRAVARDEVAHAALSWQIAGWAEALLSGEQRSAVRAAQRAAVEALRSEVAAELPARLREAHGVPCGAAGVALVAALDAELWQTAA